jgi:hypothetical protein
MEREQNQNKSPGLVFIKGLAKFYSRYQGWQLFQNSMKDSPHGSFKEAGR